MTNSRYFMTRWHTNACLSRGVHKGAHMLCKAHVQRQSSVLMFFGIKLHDCALLSKMCKCVNYAKTDCQCELKKWQIWCTLPAGVRAVACCLMRRAPSKPPSLGDSGRIIRKGKWGEKQLNGSFKGPVAPEHDLLHWHDRGYINYAHYASPVSKSDLIPQFTLPWQRCHSHTPKNKKMAVCPHHIINSAGGVRVPVTPCHAASVYCAEGIICLWNVTKLEHSLFSSKKWKGPSNRPEEFMPVA